MRASRANKFMLLAAPLEGYSERAFRSLCFKYGATKTVSRVNVSGSCICNSDINIHCAKFTEMARVDALVRDNKSTWNRLRTGNTRIPPI